MNKPASSQEIPTYTPEWYDFAAEEIFDDYLLRLTALVRSRMASNLARKFDPEDVVLSAFRSFFVAAKNGRFEIENQSGLWQLLVTISLRKLYRRIDELQTEKRSLQQEDYGVAEFIASGPTPEQAAAVTDEILNLLESLSSRDRKILELRLQGVRQVEIARELNVSDRTIRRVLDSVVSAKRDEGFDVTSTQIEYACHSLAEQVSITIPDGLPTVSHEDFFIQKHLGTGGMGKVYFGKRKSDGSPVAVKFLRKQFLKNRAVVNRFLSEAKILYELNDPRITRLVGIGKIEDQGLFLVMQWVDGTNLQVKRDPRLTQPEIVELCAQAAETLAVAHRAGVIHCDVTPANLILTPSGDLSVVDFGLARKESEIPLTSLKEVGAVAGTAAFMAPEQITDVWGAVTPKTDVYGLGATMYYLLSGKIPFPAETVPDMMAKIVSPYPPRQVQVRDVTEILYKPLENLCMMCLSKDVTARPKMQILGKTLNKLAQALRKKKNEDS